MAEPKWWSPELTRWVDQVDQHWADLGIEDKTRTRLRHDLVVDLGQALLGGAAPADLVRADPRHFAQDLLEADGLDVPRTSQRTLRSSGAVFFVITVALAGALVGTLVSVATVYPFGLHLIDSLSLTYDQEGYAAIGMYVVASILAATAAGLAVRWQCRTWPRPGRLAIALALGLLASGALAVAPTVALAKSTAYSDASSVVLLEITLVVAILVAGMFGVARALCVDRIFPHQ